MGTLIQNLLSNKQESDFSGTNIFSSLRTQLKKPCQKQAYIIPALFMIYSFFSFFSPPKGSSPGCASSGSTHTQLPTSPRLQLPRAEPPCATLPSCPASRTGAPVFRRKMQSLTGKPVQHTGFSGKLKRLPLWLQNDELSKAEEKLRDSSTELREWMPLKLEDAGGRTLL